MAEKKRGLSFEISSAWVARKAVLSALNARIIKALAHLRRAQENQAR